MKLKVKDMYTRDVVTVDPETSAPAAGKLMAEKDIRRLPVVKDGELVGIVTLSDLMRAAPSPATSLSVWEINYLVDKIKVKEIMSRGVHTVSPDDNLRVAARLMLEHKVGGLPVVENGKVIGILTESDVFRTMIDMLDEGPE